MKLLPLQAHAPLISIAMCTYNGARFLNEQLETIAAQTLLPSELVVCDDGSSDDTVALLESFGAIAPFPVHIFRNPARLGSTANFDQAISMVRGEFTALCDQDDRWAANKLQRLSEILALNPFLGGVFSDADLIDEDSQPIGTRLFARHRFTPGKQWSFLCDPVSMLLKHDVITGATLMFRTSLRTYMQPIPSSWIHDGWIAWMLGLYSQLGITTETLTAYRIHSSQQLGVNLANGSGRETRRQHYARVASQFQDLLSRLLADGPNEHEETVEAIRHKIAFLQNQSRLSPRPSLRLLQILRLLSDYRHYARGLASLRHDLALGRESL